MHIVRALLIAALLASCGDRTASSALATASPSPTMSATPTRAAEPTKPQGLGTQRPIAAPTQVRWAIDKGAPDDPAHRVIFELYFDGGATGFRIVDAAGNVVLRLPIAGSGIFDSTTCLVTANPAGWNATWVSIDDAKYRQIAANSASYRVEVDTISVSAVTLPLVDTGCRRP